MELIFHRKKYSFKNTVEPIMSGSNFSILSNKELVLSNIQLITPQKHCPFKNIPFFLSDVLSNIELIVSDSIAFQI
jgi:hypothetical protein